jgi:PPOX class probable F420-dependent enzyme
MAVVDAWVAAAIADARVARLGTVDGAGAVRLVPICFALVDDWIVSAVDHKPKRTGQLRRLDDITTAGAATVLLDHYAEDWTQLWWVRIRGRAVVHEAGESLAGTAREALMAKYEQYRRTPPAGAVYRIALDEVRWWRWSQ